MSIAVALLAGAKIKPRCSGVADLTVLQTSESEVTGFIGVYAKPYTETFGF